MKRAGLRTRLARVEARKIRRALPRIIMAIFDRRDEEVIGYNAGNVSVMRLPGEPLSALQERAWELTGAVTLAALYEAPSESSAPVVEAVSIPDLETAPTDPFALAGIGRIATREELERMGAIGTPPERLL